MCHDKKIHNTPQIFSQPCLRVSTLARYFESREGAEGAGERLAYKHCQLACVAGVNGEGGGGGGERKNGEGKKEVPLSPMLIMQADYFFLHDYEDEDKDF